MAENRVVWTHNDDMQLSQLVSKYAPAGIGTLASEVESLNAAVRAAEGTEAKDAARRVFWRNHKRISTEDAEALRTLHQKACKARLIESDEIRTLNQALAQGLISESEHRARVDSISSHVLTQVRRRALDLIGAMGEVAQHATFGALATDAEKKAAMESFAKSDAWSQALSRFKEVYDSSDAERKGELRAQHPEMFEAAIGR